MADIARQPPARVWMAQHLITNPEMVKWFDVPEDLKSLCVEYLAADPIRKALAKCQAVEVGTASESTAQVVIPKSDWENLVRTIEGEGEMPSTKSDPECECPVIDVQCKAGQVSDSAMRQIADQLHAQVSRSTPQGESSTIWGKHRFDCPAHLDYPDRMKRYAAKLKETEL